MGNGMIQAEIREKWSRHPPLLAAATFYHPTPWVLPCPALCNERGAVAAVSQPGSGLLRTGRRGWGQPRVPQFPA